MSSRILGFLALAHVTGAARYSISNAPDYADGKVNVHIVPHSHDDVGWLKTVDQYYYGANNTIQFANVRAILDSVSAELLKRPERRFTFVEVAFFARWFTELEDSEREDVRRLVQERRLSFANGGWCMHDEATTHFVAMVDQTTLGHRFLQSEFGLRPRVGWQIDPFGHSSTQASLMTYEAGFDALFFGRIDYQDREKRQQEKRCEGLWQASPSLGEDNVVFWGLTGSYQGNYGAPEGFDFDVRNPNVIPLMDDPRLHEYNIPQRVDAFVEKALSQAAQTQGKHIMMTLGSDFQYEAAANEYSNLDKLIHYVNADGRVHAFYSTPEDYMLAKNAEFHRDELVEYGVKTDDFFPYSDCEDCMWTGYFTSRPNLKKYERDMSSYLLAARQLEVLAGVGAMAEDISESNKPLRRLAEASAVAQHHDAVTGTSKQHVASDYALRLSDGYNIAANLVASAVSRLQDLHGDVEVVECPLLNASVCSATQSLGDAGVDIHIYNPLAQNRTAIVSVPVAKKAIAIFDGATGEPLDAQILPNVRLPEMATTEAQAPFSMYFQASQVPALGFRKYRLRSTESASTKVTEPALLERMGDVQKQKVSVFSISNDKITVMFDTDTRRLASLSMHDGVSIPVDQGLFYYTGFDSGVVNMDLGDCDPATGSGCPEGYAVKEHQERLLAKTPLELHAGVLEHRGDLSAATQNSGAYIFRPQVAAQRPIPAAPDGVVPTVFVINGDLVSEVVQCWTPWLNQTIRIFHGDASVYFDWSVGPVPVDDKVGKEVISRWDTQIGSQDLWYTDSNGREFLRRKRDYRPTWDLRPYQPVSGNYYPVTTGAFIQDTRATFGVLTDRAQGASSLREGSLEFMIARRLLVDDARGVGEPLNETETITSYDQNEDCVACRLGRGIVSRGTHRVVLSSANKGPAELRFAAEEVFSPLQMFFTEPSGASASGTSSAALANLPKGVKLMTLEALAPQALLVRLANIFAEGEVVSPQRSVDVFAFLGSLGFQVVDVKEVTLTANQRKGELSHLSWGTSGTGRSAQFSKEGRVNLRPMEIWTAIFQVKRI